MNDTSECKEKNSIVLFRIKEAIEESKKDKTTSIRRECIKGKFGITEDAFNSSSQQIRTVHIKLPKLEMKRLQESSTSFKNAGRVSKAPSTKAKFGERGQTEISKILFDRFS